MLFKWSDKMKKDFFEKVGISYEELIKMDEEDVIAHIEKRTGKKFVWPKNGRVDGLPIKTMEEVDKEIDEWER